MKKSEVEKMICHWKDVSIMDSGTRIYVGKKISDFFSIKFVFNSDSDCIKILIWSLEYECWKETDLTLESIFVLYKDGRGML